MPMANLTDKQVIKKIKEGQIDNFSIIVEKYSRIIFSYLKRSTTIKEDTEDILQNTFIKLYKNIEKFDKTKRLLPYLWQIAKNEMRMYFRSKKPHIKLNEEIATDIRIDDFIKEDYRHIIGSLSSTEQEILKLLMEGYTYLEIAKKVGRPLNTVRTIIRRARKKINQKKP